MNPHPFSVRSSVPLAIAIAGVLAAYAPSQIRTESFESHRYGLGPLAGADLWSGQHGWILLEPNFPPNLNGAVVQDAITRSGAQAVRFDASQYAAGSFVELRRNDLFSLTSGVLEIEFDFLVTSSPNPTEWEVYSQPYPNPQSCYLRWWIADDGRIEYHDTPARNHVQTNTFVTRDVWHHSRTVVDLFGDSFEIFLDGASVAVGTPIAAGFVGPDHGFTQIDAYDAGDDSLFVDNFTVRERTAEHGLTVDLPRLPIQQRGLLDLRLAGGATVANRPYVILASWSGTSPGTTFGSVTLPLNVDPLMGFVVNEIAAGNLPGFLGTLNGDGNAFATFDTVIPVPAALLGIDMDFAWATYNPVDAASEPAGTTFAQ